MSNKKKALRRKSSLEMFGAYERTFFAGFAGETFFGKFKTGKIESSICFIFETNKLIVGGNAAYLYLAYRYGRIESERDIRKKEKSKKTDAKKREEMYFHTVTFSQHKGECAIAQ
jgi:hypothetical protein